MRIGIIGAGNSGSTRAALAAADRARAPQRREWMVREFLALGDTITADDIVRLHRAASA